MSCRTAGRRSAAPSSAILREATERQVSIGPGQRGWELGFSVPNPYVSGMIKYALACEQAHQFESWFPTSEAFEAQRERGLVTCPFCNSPKVEKQIMAPAISGTRKGLPDPAPAPQPVVALSDKDRELRAM